MNIFTYPDTCIYFVNALLEYFNSLYRTLQTTHFVGNIYLCGLYILVEMQMHGIVGQA